MIHLPLVILLTLQVDPLAIVDQSLQLSDGLLKHLVFFGELHVFLVEVVIVKCEFIELLSVEIARVACLLSFFDDV